METVLVIEDSRPMQRTLQRLFEADSLGVRIASDGEEGLDSFRNEPPNVVILDLKLPGLSGKELCRSFSKPRASAIILSTMTLAGRTSWIRPTASPAITAATSKFTQL